MPASGNWLQNMRGLDLAQIDQAGARTDAMRMQGEGQRMQNNLYRRKLEDYGKPSRADHLANTKEMRLAAVWGDTPEKFEQAKVGLNRMFGTDSFSKFRFEDRGMLIAGMDKQIAEWSNPKAAVGPDGKPTFVQTTKKGDVRQMPGDFVPPEKKPLVEITNAGQTIDEKLLDMDLKTIEGTAASVKAGTDFMPRLEVIVQGLESGNVETGRWQEATLPIRQWAQSAGWHDDPNLDQQEAVLAAISYMIPRMRVVGSGQTSDVEIKLFAQATAQYSNTPGGNILIARGMMQMHRRNKQVLAAQRSWVRTHKTLEGFDADKEIGPMFPKVTTQAEIDKLGPGTVFILSATGRFVVKN